VSPVPLQKGEMGRALRPGGNDKQGGTSGRIRSDERNYKEKKDQLPVVKFRRRRPEEKEGEPLRRG